MRVSLFSLVLVVHAIGTINFSDDSVRGMSLLDTLNHFVRYGFVFITGFVLFLGYHGRGQSPITFWRRRFGLVVLPYLAWTVIYTVSNAWLLSEEPMPALGVLARDSLNGALRGDSKYQLYFLLISMQIYLAFPLLSAIVSRTTGHHGKLLAAAATIQLGLFVLLTYSTGAAQELTGVWAHAWKSLPFYILFLLGGALAAVHFAGFDAWVHAHIRAITVAALAVTLVTVTYFLAISGGEEISRRATSAVNPIYLPWFIAGTALLYLTSTALTDGRESQSGRRRHIVAILSVRAFGVFAVHPLVIDLIHRSGFVHWLHDTFPGSTVPRSVLLALATLIASLCVVELILRLPVSRVLVARERIPIRQPRRGAASAAP